FRLESANRFSRNSSKEFRFSNRQYCLARTSQRYSPNSTKRTSLSCSLTFSQDKISSILPSTNTARCRLISGVTISPLLIHKLVKPGKVARSRCKGKTGFDQCLVIETEPKVRAAHAAVLGKADPAVGRELSGLNLADYGCNKSAEFQALLFRDRGFEVLDLRMMLSHEDD